MEVEKVKGKPRWVGDRAGWYSPRSKKNSTKVEDPAGEGAGVEGQRATKENGTKSSTQMGAVVELWFLHQNEATQPPGVNPEVLAESQARDKNGLAGDSVNP